MLKVLSNILCDLDPKVKVICQKAGICDGVPSTSALVLSFILSLMNLPVHCTGFITLDKTIHCKSRKLMSHVYSYLSGSSDSSLSPTKVKNQETPARVSQL